MCVKLPPENLNPGPYPLHPTCIYTCRVITAPRVHGGKMVGMLKDTKMRERCVISLGN